MLLVPVGQLEATRMAPARDFKPGRFQDERAGLWLVELEQLPLESNSEHLSTTAAHVRTAGDEQLGQWRY